MGWFNHSTLASSLYSRQCYRHDYSVHVTFIWYFTRHMGSARRKPVHPVHGFLFIPVSVGLMSHFDILIDNAFSIFLSVVVGSAIVLICMGTALDRYLKRKEHS